MANAYKNKVVYGGQTLIDLSDDTVDAASMLSGRTAHDKSGAPITGTIQNQAAKTVTPGTADQTAVAAGRYTTGAVTVKGDANLKAENILSGVSIFGVAGTAEAGGGIEGGWKKVFSDTLTVNYTTKGTRQTILTHTWTTEEKALIEDKLIYVRIRDKAGARSGYFYGTNVYSSPSVPTYLTGAYAYYNTSGNAAGGTGTSMGLSAYSMSRTGSLVISAYLAASAEYDISGTFALDVFVLNEAGGDAGSYTLLASGTVTCSTAQASNEVLTTIAAEDVASVANGELIYIEIRRQGGKVNGYWCGSDNWVMKNPSSGSYLVTTRIGTYLTSGGLPGTLTGNYGIYAYASGTSLDIRATYNTNNKIPTTGTYTYRVYKMAYASSGPFD